MPRTGQKAPPTSAAGSGADDAALALALIAAAGGARDRVAAVLEEQGLEFRRVDRAGELAGIAPPPPVVLCVEGPLSGAIARDLEPLLAVNARIPAVIVCEAVRPGELRLALAAGACGVVLEDQVASALAPCLGAVRVGQVCVPRQHARQVEPAALSSREKQILGLVVMGYMNGQIAEKLFLAESTVKSHLSSAFGKLGVRSRNEAVDLILDPERGLGMGILALGGEPIEAVQISTR
jgi:DNA-binding NarL/FixJ family response regulator